MRGPEKAEQSETSHKSGLLQGAYDLGGSLDTELRVKEPRFTDVKAETEKTSDYCLNQDTVDRIGIQVWLCNQTT